MPKQPPNRPKLYWDTCLFLSMIDPDDDYFEERSRILQSLFDDASNNKIQIITSTLTITEVAFLEKEREGLDEACWEKINSLWHPEKSPVLLAGVSPYITANARELIRENMRTASNDGLPLKPADAIHLATCKYMNASAFFTFDKRLLDICKKLGINGKMPENDSFNF